MTKVKTVSNLHDKVAKLENFVINSTNNFRRQIGGFLGLSHNGKRDIYEVYGYPADLGGDDGFRRMYQYAMRQGIANRIACGIPKRCWRDGFEVYASAEEDAEPILVNELAELFKKPKMGNRLESADILNRIGRCAILYVHIPDQKSEEPLKRSTVSNNIENLRFIPFAYDGITPTKHVTDQASERYGLPDAFTLSRGNSRRHDKDHASNSITAHWTRCIILNENALESELEGTGALEPIFNDILNIEKTTGGASEAYFRNARGKFGVEIDKEFAAAFMKDETAQSTFNDKAEEFTNDQKDFMAASGSKIVPLTTPHASPLDTVKVSLWCISSQTGLPIRVLTGEGAGQLAGSEDQLTYNQIVKDRQDAHCVGWAGDLLEILSTAGYIDLPESYEIRFKPQQASTEKEDAEISNKKADTLQKVTSALSSVGGDGVDIESVLSALGLDDIEYDESKIDEIDDDIDDAITEPDQNVND